MSFMINAAGNKIYTKGLESIPNAKIFELKKL